MVFFLIFINYALAGWILFGPHIKEWNTLLGAMGSTLQLILGDFNFREIYAIDEFAASLWFYSYILITIFVVLNLLTALVYDKYQAVQRVTNFRSSQTIFSQCKDIYADYLMSQSEDRDPDSGKRKKIDYDVIYNVLDYHIHTAEEEAEDEMEDSVQAEKRRSRRLSVRDDKDYAILRTDGDFIGGFATGKVQPEFLILNCGLDPAQAEFVMKKCAKQY